MNQTVVQPLNYKVLPKPVFGKPCPYLKQAQPNVKLDKTEIV